MVKKDVSSMLTKKEEEEEEEVKSGEKDVFPERSIFHTCVEIEMRSLSCIKKNWSMGGFKFSLLFCADEKRRQ